MINNLKGYLLVIAIVISSYFLFVHPYLSSVDFDSQPRTHYQYLTAGFLSGHLSLPVSPTPQLLKLKDPYNPEQNKMLRLHDASLYNGKYYLYFGPLPVLTYFLPIKLLTGLYPAEVSAVLFFSSFSFIIGMTLLRQIKESYFSDVSGSQLIFIGLILGFANNAPFLLTRPKFYEVAIASTLFFMSLALYFLYHLLHDELKLKNAFWFSSCLALTIAGRPHFILINIILLPCVLIYLYKTLGREQPSVSSCLLSRPRGQCNSIKSIRASLIFTLFFPFISIALLLATYNYLRFYSVFEFGQSYQLASFDLRKAGLFFLKLSNMPIGFFHYFLQPYSILPIFPYIYFSPSAWVPNKPPYCFIDTMGILLSTPFVILILALPFQIKFYFKNKLEKFYPLLWFVLFAFIVPLVVSLFLISLSGGAQRYESDFVPYFIILSIISFWLFRDYPMKQKLLKTIQIFFYMTGCMSIYIGLAIGVRGWGLLPISFTINKHFFLFYPAKFIAISITSILLYLLIRSLRKTA
ncbi:MAG TPA: hypothetical protein VJN02_08665 [Gammaproteobacteria bacterium]|nr:hypothetical protein [Gammaproteobacteria bacterium]